MARQEIRIRVDKDIYTTLKLLSVKMGLPVTKIITLHIINYLKEINLENRYLFEGDKKNEYCYWKKNLC